MWFKQILDREWPKLVKEIDQKRAKITDGIANRFTGLGILESQVDSVLISMSLKTKKPQDWAENDIMTFLKSLRRKATPLLIAANKADLCDNLEILEKISDTYTVIPSSAETELLLIKASKAKLIDYVPGDDNFTGKTDTQLSEQQNNALHLAKNVMTKIQTTGCLLYTSPSPRD